MEHKNSMGSRVQVRKVKGSVRFPSLFSKLVFIYISILVIILVIVFVTFTQSFQAYFVENTKETMINHAEVIAKEYGEAGKYTTSKEEAISYIKSHIDIMDAYLQATTWIIDMTGRGYEFSSNSKMSFIGTEVVEPEVLDEIYRGRVVGYENGFMDYFSVPVLTIGYPLKINDKIQYGLFIHTPMPYIMQTIEAVRGMILRVVIGLGSILFIWIYFIARQMTRSLKEMNSVAKVIASGEFNKRIIVEGNDEIAQLGRSLNHMAEELDKIEENRNSFIASISHDLRSPLTTISGFVTAILDGTINTASQEKYLKVVLSETQRLITMTNAILDLNRMQEKGPIEKSVFNINKLIERMTLGFENRCREKNIHVYTDLNQYHTEVYAEPNSINRVIQNLLENAYKFAGDGGDILIHSKVLYDKLWISVFNSGPAIPPEQQELIWERFYKGDSSRGQDKNGIGLGLVIVKEIIKQHHEEVGVTSRKDEMVEFYFSLTLASSDHK